MGRHAYIVLAHNEPDVLRTLLRLIDDRRNEIFLHIDSKADWTAFGRLETSYARLHFLPRESIMWGGDSMMRVELSAFAAARKSGDFSRYHLLSGVDLPLRNQDEIHRFFDEEHPKAEFVGFSSADMNRPEWRAQWEYPFFFPDRVRDSVLLRRKLFSLLRRLFQVICRLTGRRQFFDGELKKGSQWVSVTQEFVDWMLARRTSIERQFRRVFCSDEKFLQTALWNSPFRPVVFDPDDEMRSSMRAIDWRRGTPYVWRSSDFDELTASGRLFARKFSSKVDASVVAAIENYVLQPLSET